MRKLKIAIIATDNREPFRRYAETMPSFAPGTTSFFEGLALMPDVEVHVVSRTQRQFPASPEKLAPNIWFHCLHVPKMGWLRTLYQGCIRATRKKLKEIQPDLVHGWGTERECGICTALSGFPNVITIQGNMAELARLSPPRMGSYGWLAAGLENFTLRRTGGVFCNSIYTESLVRPRARKTWVVAHALRKAFFEPVPDANPRPCVILNAGVISPRKRQLELLDVAEKLHKRGLKFEMHFMGLIYHPQDPYVVSFLERIKPLAAKGCARFLGTQPESKLVGCYDAVAGVVHFPTEEAFGNVVAESLARNLKFFGAAVGGMVDIATGIEGVELFSAQNFSALEEAIARWIQAGCPRPISAAAVMRERYHPEVIVRRHLEIYREVLNTRS